MISAQDKSSNDTRAGSGQMFDGIAERYDLLNRVISLGVDQRWRQQTVESLALDPIAPARVLDLATGTGDLAILLAQRYPKVEVVGVDPSANMMAVGKRKIRARELTQRINFVEGDAQRLPLDDSSFDGLTMAFGIRNVPDRARALREMARVLRPGAKAAILELSEPQDGFFGALGRFHMHRVVPWVGALLSGEREYRYLPQSIAAFPKPGAFAQMMQDAGFEMRAVVPFTFGVCQLFVGEK
jgi:demethylmenaquinone methyltransferase / 2-methoxy-6-polyprenyl-1,4-benzoquinol methylase